MTILTMIGLIKTWWVAMKIRLFRPERISGVYEFRSEDPITKERTPHLYVFTNKRIVELDYDTQEEKTVILTLQEIKKAKRGEKI